MQKIKNFFNYRSFISRAGIILIMIGVFLSIVAYIKGIHILIFIPAFVLSIFLYGLIDYLFITKNLEYSLSRICETNILKIFIKSNKKYNFILATKDKNGKIAFLEPGNNLGFDLGDNYKELYLYVFSSFDIIRKIIKLPLPKKTYDEDTNTYFYVKKYENGDNLSKVDGLKSSLKNHPYIKIQNEEIIKSHIKNKLFIDSNIVLVPNNTINITKLHYIITFIGILGMFVSFENFILLGYLFLSVILFITLKLIYGYISKKLQKIGILTSFFIMTLVWFFYGQTQIIGSIFLIQLLLFSLLDKKGEKNSFLYIFLVLFVFVGIALSTIELWFLFFFLLYLFISTYLLFFISGTESYEEVNYKFSNITKKGLYLKTLIIVIFLIFTLYFTIPHGTDRSGSAGSSGSSDNTISGFSEEIDLERVSDIYMDDSRVFVINNISLDEIRDYGLKYFRGIRLDNFDGRRWTSTIGNNLRWINFDYDDLDRITLDFHFYLNGKPHLFLPSTPIKVHNLDNNVKKNNNDHTIARTSDNPPRTITTKIDFKIKDGRVTDREIKLDEFDFSIDSESIEVFMPYIETIPKELHNNPRKIAEFIREGSGFDYSTSVLSESFEDFLYYTKSGHCEFFATTLGVTLQYLGYNAVIVNGYVDGDYNSVANSLIVRHRHAHSWVELFNEETKSWEILDPTPFIYDPLFFEDTQKTLLEKISEFYEYFEMTWYELIVNYSRETQREFLFSIYNNRSKIGMITLYLILLYFSYILIKNIYGFYILTRREKILFIIKKLSNKNDFNLNGLGRIDENLEHKYKEIIYNDKQITLKELFSDFIRLKITKK